MGILLEVLYLVTEALRQHHNPGCTLAALETLGSALGDMSLTHLVENAGAASPEWPLEQEKTAEVPHNCEVISVACTPWGGNPWVLEILGVEKTPMRTLSASVP